MEFPTLDEADVKGKTVLVRVDINSPLDPETGEILDDTRIRECSPTLRELAHRGAKVIVLAHQGRPGDEDFTTLERHTQKLRQVLDVPVIYEPDILGPAAKGAIRSLKPGEVLLLENVRFLAEEGLDRRAEEQAKTHLVRQLSELAQIYVNDAFAAAHRSQPSLVGFSSVLPSYAGRLMEKELKGLSPALKPERPCIYVLGGVKMGTSFKILESALRRGVADRVLTGGLLGQIFLAAMGADLGGPNVRLIAEKGFAGLIERAKGLLADYADKIRAPVDVVVDEGGEPREIPVGRLPVELTISDIGSRTIAEYARLIAEAGTVVAGGPLGIFEKPAFARGTLDVLKAMADSKAFTIIGGGHLVAIARAAGLADKIKHISTGGGACMSFLTGEPLPAIDALMRAKRAR